MARPKKTTTVKTAEAEQEQVQMNVPEQEAAPSAEVTPVQMVVEQKAPPVKILYIDSCIPNNQIPIGNGRYITGSGRIFAVQMEQFEGEFMTPLVMKLIHNRKFIVLSGLTDEQRMQYDCYYKEGNVIKGEGLFDTIFTMSIEKAVEVFSHLCPEHQQLVATRFYGAFENANDRNHNRVNRALVEALNKESKKNFPDGLFTPIVKAINEKI